MSEIAEQVKRLLAKADGSGSMPRAHTEKREKRCQHGPLTFLLMYFVRVTWVGGHGVCVEDEV